MPDLTALDSAFAFAGREWDNDIGLYYNRARWLDPQIGRFLSEDPLGFEGGETNPYRYAGNNPFMLTDSTGMSFLGDLFHDVGDFFSDTFKKVGNFVDSYVDNVAAGFKSFIRDPLGSFEYIVKHPGDALKGTLTDPLFWVSIATAYFKIPTFAANVTWGSVQTGIGLGGFQAPSLVGLGREAYSFVFGEGIHLGTPKLNFTALGFSRSYDVGSWLGGGLSGGYAAALFAAPDDAVAISGQAGSREAVVLAGYNGSSAAQDPPIGWSVEGGPEDQVAVGPALELARQYQELIYAEGAVRQDLYEFSWFTSFDTKLKRLGEILQSQKDVRNLFHDFGLDELTFNYRGYSGDEVPFANSWSEAYQGLNNLASVSYKTGWSGPRASAVSVVGPEMVFGAGVSGFLAGGVKAGVIAAAEETVGVPLPNRAIEYVTSGAVLKKGAKFFNGFRTGANQLTHQIGPFTKFSTDVPGRVPGSFTRWVKVVDMDAKTIQLYHDTFDKTGRFINRGFKVPGPVRHVQ